MINHLIIEVVISFYLFVIGVSALHGHSNCINVPEPEVPFQEEQRFKHNRRHPSSVRNHDVLSL